MSVDKEPARLSIRLIVANQRLQSPITLSRDYYQWIGQRKRLARREERMKRRGKIGIINEGDE